MPIHNYADKIECNRIASNQVWRLVADCRGSHRCVGASVFYGAPSQNIKGKGEEAIFSASDGVGYRIRLPAEG